MKSYVIGIAGRKNSGKDTVASMINYIFAVGKTNASFRDWMFRKEVFDNTYKDRIFHFADPLKDVLSIMYNIPREFFNRREYKDNLWYCINSGKFINESSISPLHYNIITIENLSKGKNISDYFNYMNPKLTVIKLRTLMQYFGTDICRKYLANDIWIKSALSNIINISSNRVICIVPDVRFSNEANALRFNLQSLYGGVILVERENDTYEHSSENIDFDTDFVIDNNGSLNKLFYKVLEICQTIN